MEFTEGKIKCDRCDEMIDRGILNMIRHHEDKHGLREFTMALVAERFKKGSELIENDIDKLNNAAGVF